MAWAKYVGAGLFCAALIIFGFKAATWRADAMQLDVAKLELRNELQRRVASDVDRLAMQDKLTQAQEALAKKLGTTLKAIKDHAPQSPDCNVPDDIAGQLSALRHGS